MVIMEPGEDIVDISVGTESTLAVTSLGELNFHQSYIRCHILSFQNIKLT